MSREHLTRKRLTSQQLESQGCERKGGTEGRIGVPFPFKDLPEGRLTSFFKTQALEITTAPESVAG